MLLHILKRILFRIQLGLEGTIIKVHFGDFDKGGGKKSLLHFLFGERKALRFVASSDDLLC